jgi:hypothetical protein
MEIRFLDQVPQEKQRRRTSMKAIHEAAGQDLQWRGKKEGLFAEDEFELRSGDEVFALLHAREKGTDWICSEAAEGRWALQYRNIGPGKILVIRELDSQAVIAVVKRGRKHGLFQRDHDSLEFSDGRIVTWKKASTWHDEWDWADSDGRPLIHFQRGQHVVLEPHALALPELSLLVIVGWQLMQLQEEARKKAAVTAAVATTTSSSVVVHP